MRSSLAASETPWASTGTRKRTRLGTDNGRDLLGDEVPPDELNYAPSAGVHFGFPYGHGKDIADPEFGWKHACREFVPPVVELGAHVAALGIRFYTGQMFPHTYQNQVFIAEHGSWNRSMPVGYRVTLVAGGRSHSEILTFCYRLADWQV